MTRSRLSLATFLLCAALLSALPNAFAMNETTFGRLLEQLRNVSFSSEQLAVIRSAAVANTFSSEQVRRVLAELSFSSDQLEALRLMSPQLEDPENAFTILDSFSFSSDVAAAEDILRRTAPATRTVTPAPAPSRARLGILLVRLWPEDALARLLSDLEDAPSAQEQLELLRRALYRSDGLSAEQATRVLARFAFDRYRLEAAWLLRHRLIDSRADELAGLLQLVEGDRSRLELLEAFRHALGSESRSTALLEAFSFSTYREEARLLLAAGNGF